MNHLFSTIEEAARIRKNKLHAFLAVLHNLPKNVDELENILGYFQHLEDCAEKLDSETQQLLNPIVKYTVHVCEVVLSLKTRLDQKDSYGGSLPELLAKLKELDDPR